MGSLFRASKFVHKYLGLLLLAFCLWESVSGILLNHPELSRSVVLPSWLIPPQYRLADWNRSALKSIAFSEETAGLAYLWGWEGVWKTSDGGESFVPLDRGFPSAPYERRTNTFWMDENAGLLLAGTITGLFTCDLDDGAWSRVPLGPSSEPVSRIAETRDTLVVFTRSHAYVTDLPVSPSGFREAPLVRRDPEPRVSLVKLFFALHGGHAWGLSGRLLFDAAGLVIIFLSVSAFYVWYWPWRWGRTGRSPGTRPAGGRLLGMFHRYHLKLGIWFAPILLLIGCTALFMRPPPIALLLDKSIPDSWYPGLRSPNPWHDAIQNACYDPLTDCIVIEADGFWSGPADLSGPFEKMAFPAPVFAMGTTVLECDEAGNWLVGSFGGLFRVDRRSGALRDLLPAATPSSRRIARPGDFMVTGYFETPGGESFAVGHGKGVLGLEGTARSGRFAMPAEVATRHRMTLWNLMFELHNGRLFKDLVGSLYILIPLGGSFLFVIITLTGIFDWCVKRLERGACRS